MRCVESLEWNLFTTNLVVAVVVVALLATLRDRLTATDCVSYLQVSPQQTYVCMYVLCTRHIVKRASKGLGQNKEEENSASRRQGSRVRRAQRSIAVTCSG